MAYPQVGGSAIGHEALTPTRYHTIGFPSDLHVNDLIIGVICNAPNVTTDWGFFSIYSSSGNFSIYNFNYGVPYYGFNACIIYGLSKGGTLDELKLESTSSTACIARWQLYKVTGHNATTLGSLKYTINSGDTASDFTSNYVPSTDDSVVDDYLYMQFVTYNGIDYSPDDLPCTTLVQPTSWTNLLHDGKLSDNEASIASCRLESTSSRLNPTTWNNDPAKNYIVFAFRIPSGTLGGVAGSNPGFGTEKVALEGVMDSGPTGFNIWTYGDSIESVPTISVVVEPATQNYNSDGSENSNPYGTYVKVTSTGSWTAAWTTGVRFTAGSYSGSAGVSYIAITCNGSNSSGGNFTDVLTFTCTPSTDAVTIIQVSS